jgi:predicted small lipoprotein YifL
MRRKSKGPTSVVACFFTLVAALFLALGLGACGQKGPLTLPVVKAPADAASGSGR